jgi:excisionase family DNA binding protein
VAEERNVMTVAQVAEYLGISHDQVYRIDAPYVRLTDRGVRRYLRADVDAWLASRRERSVSAAEVAARIRAKRGR